MKEELLHFIWKYQLFNNSDLRTDEQESLQIIYPGQHNHHAGPDFSDAKVKIGDTLWAGNIEIHLTSSDWLKHKHHLDPAYENVILHVVFNHDKNEKLKLKCPTLELSDYLENDILDHYVYLMQNKEWIACKNQIQSVPTLIKSSWQNRLLIIRLEKEI
jgi:hypothetical protein